MKGEKGKRSLSVSGERSEEQRCQPGSSAVTEIRQLKVEEDSQGNYVEAYFLSSSNLQPGRLSFTVNQSPYLQAGSPSIYPTHQRQSK